MGRDKSRSPSRKHKDKEKKEKKEKKERKDHDRDYDRGHRERSPDRYESRDRPRDDYGGPPRDRDRHRDYGPPPPGDPRSAGGDLRGPPGDYRDRDYDRDREVRDRDRDRERDRDRDRDRYRESERSDRGGERRGRGDDGDGGGEPSSKRRREGSAAPGAGATPSPGGLTGAMAAALGMTAEAAAVAARPGLTAEEAAQQRRDAEAAVLEQQAERRRKAVEEWRKKRMADQGITEPEAQPEVKEEQAEGDAPGAAAASNGGEGAASASNGDAAGEGGPEGQPGEEGGEAGAGSSKQKNKGWSLEDDDEDDDAGAGAGPDEEMPDADAEEDGDALRPPPMLGIKKEQDDDDDDDDPLDAFMGGLGAGGAGKGPRPAAGSRPTPGKPLLGSKFGAPVGLAAKKGFVFAAPGAAAAAAAAGAVAAGAGAGTAAAAKLEPSAAAEAAGAVEGGAAAAAVPGAAAGVKPRRKWAPVEPEPKLEAGGGDDDEVDPLDAFMAAEVLPEVHKLAAAAAQAVEDAAAAAREPSPAPAPDSDDMEVDGDAQVKPDPDLPGPSSRLSPPPVAGPSARVNGNVGPGAGAGPAGRVGSVARRKPRAAFKRRAGSSDESSSDGDDEDKDSDDMDDAEWARLVTAGKLSKGDKLVAVDHSTIDYPPFRKNFYIEVTELTRLSAEELAELRAELDGIKVRGKNIPAPVRSWTQAGLSSRILEVLKKRGFDRPLPIQAQALPIIMSGRDCIGIAKTGSGKTDAFVLPMMRHIKDQPPLEQGDGPVALVIAPTRELVAQIAKEAKAFAKPLGLNALAVFGGSGVANQITELKRGVEIVACTPGRMIDLLVTSNGKITNLRRVTYLVLDEADRMFDMGFEPQISRIVQNIRPDRQTVMFSATFPRSVEALARKILHEPVEIQVGGRSVVNDSITQWVEIRPEKERFHRLLEILGEWYERGKLLIFVDKQESCDNLFRDLLRYGYPCLSLHGGKDQSDRESTIADFKGAVCNILVATSIAARGLDVKDLVLVVNYDVPNHHEDYVHRVGRTGRAGAKGTAITFIGEEEERYAPDLVKALRESGAPVPQDLQVLADSFNTKHKAGLVKAHGSGYGGTGFKFDNNEEERHRTDKKAKAKAMGLEVEGEDEAEEAALDAAVASLDADDIRPKSSANTNTGSASAPMNPADSVSAVVAAAREKLAEAAKAGLIQVPSVTGGAPGAGAAGAAAAGAAAAAQAAASAAAAAANPLLAAAQQVAAKLTMQVTAGMPPSASGPAPMSARTQGVPGMPSISADALARAAAIAAKFGGTIALPGSSSAAGGAGGGAGRTAPGAPAGGFEAELEINDFPQHARWKITHRETMNQINELTGAALTVRGTYVQPGRPVPEGERKLFLLIEGPTEQHVKKAKAEIKKILEETTEKIMRRDAPAAGRYSVM